MLEFLSAPYVAVTIVVLLAIVLWWRWRVTISRQVVASAVLTLVAFQILFFLQGSLSLPTEESPTGDKVMATIALVLAVNTLVQLVKWIFVEFAIVRRGVLFPRFVLDLLALIVLVGVGLAVVSEIFGVELTGILVTSTVASAIIGLALQDVLSNLIAGIALQVESPFAVGNWVEVDGQEGQVVRLNWRTLSLITRENHYVVLPNSNVSREKIINYSRPTKQQEQSIYVGVAYSHPPGEVKRVLLGAVNGYAGVLDVPGPKVFVDAYDDFSVNYRVIYYIERYSGKREIRDAILTRIWYALKRAGMVIPFPIRDVNMRVVPEDERERLAQQATEGSAEFLRALSILAEWSDIQIAQLAEAAETKGYTDGEALVRQGDEGDSLFWIKEGSVGIYLDSPGGGRIRADEGGRGDFFGEMSLLTGEPRSASILAETETEALIIHKHAFAELLTADPAILDLMLDVVEKRRSNLEARLAADDQRRAPEQERHALITRIARFLGIPVEA